MRLLVSLGIPTVATALIVTLVWDPTLRYPLVALMLPAFLRGAASALGIYEVRESRTIWVVRSLGTMAFFVGWTLAFSIVGYMVAVGVFGFEASNLVMKRAIVVASLLGFGTSAWFLWPYYARDVVSAWPIEDQRIWVSSSNQWDQVFRAYRLRAMARSGPLRLIGFGATLGVVVAVFGLTVLGAYEGTGARVTEALLVLLLPALHYGIVLETHLLSVKWREQRRDLADGASSDTQGSASDDT
ncbi:MAG: hypothetical protein O2780_10335 [Proteobacteria bacterium]|jgi:hypothetical protein|nr:hypothetical protein [Pseudomonadota bacterium]MDA1299320.1 hypothetical protein [Pseudomonadota bacterium]